MINVFTLMKRSVQTVVITCSVIASPVFAEESTQSLVGSAYSLKTGDLLYRETHKKVSDEEYTVEYSEPDGQVFGFKTIDFSNTPITPSFSQTNNRNGEKIDVKLVGKSVNVEYKENAKSAVKKEKIDLVPSMVIDAGFDAFIKRYWSTLASGKTMDIEYLVPTKQTTFSFKVNRAPCLEGTDPNAICFALSPASWFVKLAVDPIVVAYQSEGKKLLRFTGRANICDAEGKYQSVDIQYRYF